MEGLEGRGVDDDGARRGHDGGEAATDALRKAGAEGGQYGW